MSDHDSVWGVDPGSSGCLVSIRGSYREVEECRFSDSEGPRWYTTATWIKHRIWPGACFVEAVHAMPGDGKSTMFTFGKNVGIIEGMLYAHSISFNLVVPDTWRREFGLAGRKYSGTKSQQRSARKRDHLEVAKQIFPGVKLTQETCDAYLIAEYGWRQTFGRQESIVNRQLREGTGIIRVSQE